MTIRMFHMLALFWMMGGLGAVMVPVWRAWRLRDEEHDRRALLLTEASANETRWLLPGLLAAALTGFAWAALDDIDPVGTGWLVALEVIFLIDAFIFVPLLGVGLRRARLLALQAKKKGEITDELRAALADNVPVVFGTLVVLSVPVMLWLAVFQPF